jgi:hypothetical protein
MSELLTTRERERRVRNAKIVGDFKTMRRIYPDASNSRIIAEMARESRHEVKSTYAIRKVLLEAGVISRVR